MRKVMARALTLALLVGAVLVIPGAAAHSDTDQCPAGGTTFSSSGTFDGITVTISGPTVTFSPVPTSIDFCVKAATTAKSLDEGDLTAGGSFTVDWLNNGGQTPDISHIVIYSADGGDGSPGLPVTGFNPLPFVGLALVLLIGGAVVLRRRTA
jgi:hypothetical protein